MFDMIEKVTSKNKDIPTRIVQGCRNIGTNLFGEKTETQTVFSNGAGRFLVHLRNCKLPLPESRKRKIEGGARQVASASMGLGSGS